MLFVVGKQIQFRSIPPLGLEPRYPAWEASMITTYIMADLVQIRNNKIDHLSFHVWLSLVYATWYAMFPPKKLLLLIAIF